MRVVDVKVRKDYTVALNEGEVRMLLSALCFYVAQETLRGTELRTAATKLRHDIRSMLAMLPERSEAC
jgi:hypothetical protein